MEWTSHHQSLSSSLVSSSLDSLSLVSSILASSNSVPFVFSRQVHYLSNHVRNREYHLRKFPIAHESTVMYGCQCRYGSLNQYCTHYSTVKVKFPARDNPYPVIHLPTMMPPPCVLDVWHDQRRASRASDDHYYTLIASKLASHRRKCRRCQPLQPCGEYWAVRRLVLSKQNKI